jgi:hypothetical protein
MPSFIPPLAAPIALGVLSAGLATNTGPCDLTSNVEAQVRRGGEQGGSSKQTRVHTVVMKWGIGGE